MNRNISDLIYELVEYGKRTGLVEADDEIYCSNRLLELFEVSDFARILLHLKIYSTQRLWDLLPLHHL